MWNRIVLLSQSYVFVLIASLAIGVGFHSRVVFLAPYSTLFLAIIFFLSALKINLKESFRYLSDKKMLFSVNVFMLLILPVIVYFATEFIYPSLALPFMILAAMPSGMTSPFLSEISGGTQSLALVFTVSTSLLAPITVPLIIGVLAGTEVSVGFLTMFLSLAKVIFIPFILAHIVKYFWEEKVRVITKNSRPVSMILLGLLIVGIVAKQADAILSSIQGGTSFIYLIGLFILFIAFHVFGYFLVFWRNKKDRVTITVCLTYLNFTLAVYLADQFFKEPHILIPIVLSVLPWSILLIPFKYFVKRIGIVS